MEAEGTVSVDEKGGSDVTPPPAKCCKLQPELNPSLLGEELKRRGKRKCIAMLMSYYGKGYFGMQVTRSEQHPGIEDVFGKILVQTDMITQEDYVSLGKIHFQRACRTDKNVSAVRQLISFRSFQIEDPISRINSLVPPNIKVHAIKKVTKGFDGKKWASSRIYQYLVPSYCFQHIDSFNISEARHFRAPDELIARINQVLLHYKGTKNFHNFTLRKESKDASADRYIMEFGVKEKLLWPLMKNEQNSNVCVENGNDSSPQVEFFILEVHGQSFMLHQIRKMIGLTMAVVRGNTSEDIYSQVFEKAKLDIPKAPSIGLYLENVFFKQYNKKFGTDGIHEPLEWSAYEAEVEKFKKEHIVANLLNDILSENIFEDYMDILQYHSYSTKIGHRLVKIPRGGKSISNDEDDEIKDESNPVQCEQTFLDGEQTSETVSLEIEEKPPNI